MADPVAMTSSVIATAVKSTKSLRDTIQRYKNRDRTLSRLQGEVDDLGKILGSLTQMDSAEAPMLALLRGPIDRCSEVCSEFETEMEAFKGKSKTGFLDWTKMEFMRGNINEFIDTISGYKSTISVGLGTVALHNNKVSQQVIQEYNEMIQNTIYDLELQLQRVDDKITQLTVESSSVPGIDIDLKDEKEVTKQCLRICEDARSYIESLTKRESPLIQASSQHSNGNSSGELFEAQTLTFQGLETTQDSFAQITDHLRKRLETLFQNENLKPDSERSQLQEDIAISKQCLEVCKMASEISRQKVYRVGEVIADDNSDQVVVTTLADLFDVGKATSKNNSAQLVAYLTEDSLRDLTEKRYNSRFGAATSTNDAATTGASSSPPVSFVQRTNRSPSPQTGHGEQSSGSRSKQDRPSPNEVRKRTNE